MTQSARYSTTCCRTTRASKPWWAASGARENVFHANANRLDRMRQYDGIAVVTGLRVVFVKRSGMNKLSTEMPLHNIESVDMDGDAEVTLTGRSYSNWVGHGDPLAFKMRGVQPGYARYFADRVRQVRDAPPAPATPVPPSASAGAAVPTANYAGMSKAERINAQWRERSTMWSRERPQHTGAPYSGAVELLHWRERHHLSGRTPYPARGPGRRREYQVLDGWTLGATPQSSTLLEMQSLGPSADSGALNSESTTESWWPQTGVCSC